jgi:nuclease-like protein
MAGRSPLKNVPLRNPGDSLDQEIQRWGDEKLAEPLWFAGGFFVLAVTEWVGDLTHAPRRPVIFTLLAVGAIAYAAWRIRHVREKLRRLRQGRDGERCVGQFLERLRERGAQLFHDVPGEGFNLDHVIIAKEGIFVVETKTLSKPWPKASIKVEGETISVANHGPTEDPIRQVIAGASWLSRVLEASTGKRFAVRGVVVYPGWYVEQIGPRGAVWVLEPKALPGFIERESEQLGEADVRLAAFHLSRFIRSELEQQAA